MASTPRRLSKSITIEAPTATELVPMFVTNGKIKITEIQHRAAGGTDVTWQLYHSTTPPTAGVAVHNVSLVSPVGLTGTVPAGTVNVPADSEVWIATIGVNGTPTELLVTVFYTEE